MSATPSHRAASAAHGKGPAGPVRRRRENETFSEMRRKEGRPSLGLENQNSWESNEMEMSEVMENVIKARNEGCKLLSGIFDDSWIEKIESCIKEVETDEYSQLCGEYFIYRWLFEDNNWEFVNRGEIFDEAGIKHIEMVYK